VITSASKHRRAFSIIEMIVVLSIILIATSVALITYSNQRKTASIRGAAERLKSILVEARTRAIASNTITAATLDLSNQVVWVDVMENDTTVRTPKVTTPEPLPQDALIDELRIGADTFTSDLRRVVFQPDGSNQLTTVIVRGKFGPSTDANSYSVQLYPASAEPRVWPRVRR
jgi:prepilin-type N-terminal cleavage/methylation domain-containing protein